MVPFDLICIQNIFKLFTPCIIIIYSTDSKVKSWIVECSPIRPSATFFCWGCIQMPLHCIEVDTKGLCTWILQSQQYKPLSEDESVQPLFLLFQEQRSDMKLQPSTRIANGKNKSGNLYRIKNTLDKQELFFNIQTGLSYLRYKLP